jgi:hypothetical protein
MNHSIHDPATGTVTPENDPRQELPRTLYDFFLLALKARSDAAGGRFFFASHRELAAELDCSAGAIPRLMERAIEDDVLYRKRAGKTFRLKLIDSGRPSLWEQPPAGIDHTPPPPAPPAAPTEPYTAESMPAAAACETPVVIDQILPHEVCHDSCQEGEESARTRVSIKPADREWLMLGINPTKLDMIRRWGGTPAEFRAAAQLKQQEGARSPIGAVIAAIERGVALLDWRQWAQEASDGAGGTGPARPSRPRRARASSYQSERPPRGRAPAGQFADPESYYDCLGGGLAALGLSAAPA